MRRYKVTYRLSRKPSVNLIVTIAVMATSMFGAMRESVEPMEEQVRLNWRAYNDSWIKRVTISEQR